MPENDTIKEEELTVLDSLADIKASVGKIMSIDFGDVRTGLAICDASRFLASGIGYISPGGIEKTAAAVADAAKENRAAAIAPNSVYGSSRRNPMAPPAAKRPNVTPAIV